MGYLYVSVVLLVGALSLPLARLVRGAWSPSTFSQISAVILTPLSVLFGFIAGFLALQVWTAWDRAGAHVSEEANAIREAVMLADAGDPALAARLRSDLAAYLDGLPREWRAMQAGAVGLALPAPAYVAALHHVATYAGPAPSALVLKSLDDATDARARRLVLNESSVLGHGRWLTLVVLAGLLQLMIAMVHAHHRAAQVVAVSAFTAAAAASLLMVAGFDQPYRASPRPVDAAPLLALRALVAPAGPAGEGAAP
jgi:hypothetical protein